MYRIILNFFIFLRYALFFTGYYDGFLPVFTGPADL